MTQFKSPTQKLIYEFYKAHINQHEYSPTLEEVGTALGYTIKTIRLKRQELKDDGFLDFVAGAQRSVTILK